MSFELHDIASVANIMQNNSIMTMDEVRKPKLYSFMYTYTKKLVATMLSQFISIEHRWQLLTKHKRSIKSFFYRFINLMLTKQSLRFPLLWNNVPHT